MLKKRSPINLGSRFMLLSFSLLLFFIFGCNPTTEKNKYNGKWILQKQYYNEDIIFKGGNFTKEYSHDDLRVHSTGTFYLNANENRIGTTLSLIPDKIISEKDTIYQECENLDVIEINDSNLIILKPNQKRRDAQDRFISVNETLIYRKSSKTDL